MAKDKAAVSPKLDLTPVGGSYPFALSTTDITSVIRTLLTVGVGAIITYISSTYLPVIAASPWAYILVPLITALLDAGQKFISDTRPAAEKAKLPYKLVCQERAKLNK